jgi:hypothetical protein
MLHALVDPGQATHLGVALCGIPAQYLTIVPDLAWDEAEASSRWERCQQEWPAGA